MDAIFVTRAGVESLNEALRADEGAGTRAGVTLKCGDTVKAGPQQSEDPNHLSRKEYLTRRTKEQAQQGAVGRQNLVETPETLQVGQDVGLLGDLKEVGIGEWCSRLDRGHLSLKAPHADVSSPNS